MKCILHDYKPVREVKKPVLADGIFGFKRPKAVLYECSQCEHQKWKMEGF